MKVHYEFVTEERKDIEVPDELGQVIMDMEKKEKNRNRTETRRHSSMEKFEEQGVQYVDKTVDIENSVLCNLENKKLHKAIGQLLPQQKELIKKVYFENRKITEIARELGVDKTSIRDRLERIYEKIKKDLI